LIALLLTISTISALVTIPNANAHSPEWQIPTYAYIVAAPNPVGVGQEAHVYMWLDSVYGAAGGTTAVVPTNGSTASAGLLSNNYRFHNYKLTIKAPDGTTSTQVFGVISDTTSSQFTKLTPDQVGTYTLTFDFPGQVYGQNGNGYEKSSLINDTYVASTSTTTLTVQQDPIPAAITSYPLPTAYWTHPIYGENSFWFSISSNWLGSGSPVPAGYTSSSMFRSDAVGSLTSHIMWTRPLQFGGVAGGNQFVAGSSNPDGAAQGAMYFEGSSYQPRFVNPIIISGYLYYTEPRSFSGPSSGPTDCVDLRTGQVIWSRSDVPAISFGYIYNLWDPDQHGTYPPILFTANFARAFDAYSGDQLFNVTGVPTGTAVAGPGGEQIRYVLTNTGTTANPAWYLQQWNSSKMWIYDINPFSGAGSVSPSLINASNLAFVTTFPASPTSAAYTNTITVNANIPINDTTLGLTGQYATSITSYDWNVSIPWRNTMTLTPTVIGANYGDIMLCRNGSLPIGFAASQNGASQAPYTMFAVNLNGSKGQIGSILWMKNYNPPAGNITMQLPSIDYQTRVFVYQYYETMQWVGFNLDTGVPMWGPTEPETAFNYYDWSGYNPGVMAYGNLYSGGFGGVLYCFNDLTGELKWTYGNGGVGNSTYAGLNVFYGVYPSYVQNIANGVVYFAADEHTIPNPLYKGTLARALNATTGQEIWTLSEYPSEWAYSGSQWATADGFTAFMNGLDNNVYSIGRGPSSLTVQAPLTEIAVGNKVVIQGTVMDISAGTTQTQQAADFPHGVPVASDASMKDWMGYVYQQKPLPTNFTGVPVTISAVDPNGNSITIGNAITDTNGKFHYTWTTPNVPGDYTVKATFAGTNGYWPSADNTALTVTEAPQTTATPTIAASSQADMYFLPVSIAIILAIVIVGVVLALLMLRKRP
jgi:outer membrane protein assembly factor BamB